MSERFKHTIGRGFAALTLASAMVVATVAEAGPPTLSTNPGNLAIFPARGQTPEQQKQDEAAAYDWASQQTRWDPYQAKAVLDQQEHAAAAASGAARGGAVRGAAGGRSDGGGRGRHRWRCRQGRGHGVGSRRFDRWDAVAAGGEDGRGQ